MDGCLVPLPSPRDACVQGAPLVTQTHASVCFRGRDGTHPRVCLYPLTAQDHDVWRWCQNAKMKRLVRELSAHSNFHNHQTMCSTPDTHQKVLGALVTSPCTAVTVGRIYYTSVTCARLASCACWTSRGWRAQQDPCATTLALTHTHAHAPKVAEVP